jgi:hypothetical protein
LALVMVKPAPIATAATSESRTLRISFSLGVCLLESGEREETPYSPASSGKWLLLKQYGQLSELPVGLPFIWRSSK